MIESKLLRFNKKQPFVVFDIESEDLRLLKNRGWQLSYTLATLQDGIIEEHDDFLWWDDLNISEGAARVTRFEFEDYKRKAKPSKPILEKFSKVLYNPDYLLLGANIMNFDIHLVNTMFRQLELDFNWSFVDRLLDIQCIEKAKILGRAEFPQEPNKRAAMMFELANWHKRGVKTSVKHLATNVYNIPYDEFMAHDAKYDNSLVWEIFKKQVFSINI